MKNPKERMAELTKARDEIQNILREVGGEITINVLTDQLRIVDVEDELSDLEAYFQPPHATA